MNFETIRQVKHPMRANPVDAGIDFFIPDDYNDGFAVELDPGEDVLIPMGVKVEVPYGWALVFMDKSGIATRNKLIVGACVIDCGYSGEVHAHMINYSDRVQRIKPGTKIVQGLLLQVGLDELHHVERIKTESERGAGGFGSTGV